MTPDIVIVLQLLAALNLVALTFIGWRLRAPVQVTIHQPAMTVQSPPAILPPELLDLMRQLDAKLQPPALPSMTDDVLERLTTEGVQLAEGVKGVKGPHKFRTARSYVVQQAQGLGLTIDDRTLALRIEAAALARFPKKK